MLSGLLIGYIPYVTVAFISNLNTKTNDYAAVLLSADAFTGHDHWAPPIAFLGSYPSWTLYFNSKGQKIEYVFSATENDFYTVLMDDKYQSIVLVGHGSSNCWKATDGLVENSDIIRLEGKFRKKNGEWFQLSCPSKDVFPVHIGELVMSSGNVYHYRGNKADNVDFVLDALFAFKHMKAESGKTKQQPALKTR